MNHARFARLFAQCDRIVEALHQEHGFPRSDCDDLRQEMALALLEMEGGTDNFCLTRAAWRAVDWLRRFHVTRLEGYMITTPNVAALVDSGRCLRVWC